MSSPYPGTIAEMQTTTYTPVCTQEAQSFISKFTFTEKTTAEEFYCFITNWSPFTNGKKIALLGAYDEKSGKMSVKTFLKVLGALKSSLAENDTADLQIVFCVNKAAKLPEEGKPTAEDRARNSSFVVERYNPTFSGAYFRPAMVLEVKIGKMMHVSSDSYFSNFTELQVPKPIKAIDLFPSNTKYADCVRNCTAEIRKAETIIQDTCKTAASVSVPADPSGNPNDNARVKQIAKKQGKILTIAGHDGATHNSLDGVHFDDSANIVRALNEITIRKIRETDDVKQQKLAAQDLIIADRYFNGARPIAHGDLCLIGETRTLFVGPTAKVPGVNTMVQWAAYLFGVAYENSEVETLTPVTDLFTAMLAHGCNHEEAAIYEGIDPDTKQPIYKPDHSFGGDRIHSWQFCLQAPQRLDADGNPAPNVKGYNAQHHSVQLAKLFLGNPADDKELFDAACDFIGQPMDKRHFVEVPATFSELDSVLETPVVLNVDNLFCAAKQIMERAFDIMSGYDGPPLVPKRTPSC